MGVEDPSGEGVVDRLGQHRAEAGHHDHVHPGGHQGVGHRPRVPLTVEPGAEPAEVGPVDQDGRVSRRRRPRRGPGTGGRRRPGRTGRSVARMASRMVPLPEASTPIRTGDVNVSRVESGGHGRTLPAPPVRRSKPEGPPERALDGLVPVRGARVMPPVRPARRIGLDITWSPLPRGTPLVDRPSAGPATNRSAVCVLQPSATVTAGRSRWSPVRWCERCADQVAVGAPSSDRRARSSKASSESSTRSQKPHRGESSAAGSGTATTRMRAALAEMAPLNESSKARQADGVDTELGRGRLR